MTEANDSDYTSIMPTAFLTAFPRTLTDIPFSKAIFEELVNLRKAENLPEIDPSLIVQRLAPELEARYKLIDKLLFESDIPQILELAAGLSPRGLILTGNNAAVQYAELELPDMVAMKRKILNKITGAPENLHLVAGNALRLKDIQAATSGFDTSKPVAVINEGLLRYLNFTEKAQIAANVRHLLEKFGGIWITSDTTPRKFLKNQDTVTQTGFNTELAKTSGKNFNNTMFDDLDHFTRFFNDLGFDVQAHLQREIQAELSSPKILKITSDETSKLLKHGVVVVMRLRN